MEAILGDDAPYFSHPCASVPEPMGEGGLPLLWTGDIDDMLLLNARQHAFDFGARVSSCTHALHLALTSRRWPCWQASWPPTFSGTSATSMPRAESFPSACRRSCSRTMLRPAG